MIELRGKGKYVNAMLKGLHCQQLIEETCNGDDHSNHFRNIMTLEDCEFSYREEQMWKRYAMEYCL